jgi:hypothetical protein
MANSRTTRKLPVDNFLVPEQEVTPTPAPETTLKPFVINMDALELGDLEFMESLAELEGAGKQPSTKQIFELFTRFFEGWTIEDCRKIKLNQVEQVKQQLFASLAKAVPNGSGTAS